MLEEIHGGQRYSRIAWFRTTTRRNKEADITRTPALLLDADVTDWLLQEPAAGPATVAVRQHLDVHPLQIYGPSQKKLWKIERVHPLPQQDLEMVKEEMYLRLWALVQEVVGQAPTIVTDSGHGYHLLWWLLPEQGYRSDEGAGGWKAAKEMQTALVYEINRRAGYSLVDEQVSSTNELLRVPGTYNTKPGVPAPRLVRQLLRDTSRRLDLKGLSSRLLPSRPTRATQPGASKNKSAHSRSEEPFQQRRIDFSRLVLPDPRCPSRLRTLRDIAEDNEQEWQVDSEGRQRLSKCPCPETGSLEGAFLIRRDQHEVERWDSSRHVLRSNAARISWVDTAGYAHGLETVGRIGARTVRASLTSLTRALRGDSTAPLLRMCARQGSVQALDPTGHRAWQSTEAGLIEDVGSWMFDRYGVTPEIGVIKAGIRAVTVEHDPALEYLQALQSFVYDGRDYIAQMVQAMQVKTPDEALAITYMKKWLTAAVARTLEPGCQVHSILVLRGEQAANKTSWLRVLANIPGYDGYGAIEMDTGRADLVRLMRRAWLVEWSEMSGASRAEQEKLKAFITEASDSIVPKYQERAVDYPRRSVVAATTNSTQVLRDATGDRRFWCIDAEVYPNRAWMMEHRDRIWRQALSLYEAPLTEGEDRSARWFLTPEEDASRREANEFFREMDPYEDLVRIAVSGCSEVTLGELLQRMGTAVSDYQKMRERIQGTLMRLGIKETRERRVDGSRPRRYIIPADLQGLSSRPSGPGMVIDFDSFRRSES